MQCCVTHPSRPSAVLCILITSQFHCVCVNFFTPTVLIFYVLLNIIMVKFGKNKFKVLNKLDKKQNDTTPTNKVIKKKINAEKKVAFQKEVLLKEAFKSAGLVKNISTAYVLQKKSENAEALKPKQEQEEKKTKLKPVLKQKKRQKMQIDDTKLLLGLMKRIR